MRRSACGNRGSLPTARPRPVSRSYRPRLRFPASSDPSTFLHFPSLSLLPQSGGRRALTPTRLYFYCLQLWHLLYFPSPCRINCWATAGPPAPNWRRHIWTCEWPSSFTLSPRNGGRSLARLTFVFLELCANLLITGRLVSEISFLSSLSFATFARHSIHCAVMASSAASAMPTPPSVSSSIPSFCDSPASAARLISRFPPLLRISNRNSSRLGPVLIGI